MKTKVIHVITKLELGGAQKVTLMTLERLSRDRYDLALVTGPEGLLVDWANRIDNLDRVWIPSLIREVRPVQDFKTLWSLLKLFRREKPVIVHTHSTKAGILGRWAARLAGVPFIFHTAHGFGFHDFQRPAVKRFYVWLERLTTKITTRLIVVSYANAEKGERNGVFKRGDWILCRDAISVKEFMQSGPRRRMLSQWGIPPEKLVVGMIACLKPQKSPVDFVDVAARVLKEFGPVHFVLAGDGELRPQVEERIQEQGISEHFTLLGWQRDMPEVYRNLDIVVLTSLWEGLPCVFSEAMAGDLPIVATNVDGAREAIMNGENGFLHEPHDVEGMASSVLKLLRDPDLRKAMGTRGKSRVMEFDISTSVANLESAYRECLDSR
ncbi:MAG TPA: glycosyltransferase family 4 protein [Terriglobia bacterium]|nr:glycosyltransferase family 4 protein [Terriglobia bacterium]